MVSCNEDDLESISFNGRLTSEVTDEPIGNITIVGRTTGVRGSGLFSSTYEIDRQEVQTNANGEFSMFVDYESYDFTAVNIFKGAGGDCTELLEMKRNFFVAEVENKTFDLKARRLYPIEIRVKNVEPFDEEDSIYISIVELDPNNPYDRAFDIENFGVQNQPRDPNQTGVGENLYWVGENVNSVLRSKVQEDAVMILHYSVYKNGNLEPYQTEPIPTVNNGVTRFELNY